MRTINLHLHPPLLDELETAAHEKNLTMQTFASQILECYAAERRLFRIEPAENATGARPPGPDD
jgi:hypothetical protein